MTGTWRTISVALTANSTQYQRAMAQASASTAAFDKQADKVTNGKRWTTWGKAAAAGFGLLSTALVASIAEAISWESAFAGVAKTVDATESELAGLETGLINMSLRLPATRTEIAAVAEAAGQLGISTPHIEAFTETMIGLGESTNLTADEAATGMARFANVMGTSQDQFDELADTLVHLGNNGASTEREILDMSLRLAGMGNVVGLTENEVLALANAMSSLGITSELGGGAFSRIMGKMYSSVLDGGEKLEGFAKVAGMSADEFAEKWRTSPSEAITSFVDGLGRVNDSGGNVISTLRELGIKGTQEVMVLQSMMGGADGLVASFEDAENAAGALATETERRYATVASQLEVLRNKVTYVGLAVGTELLPAVVEGIRLLEDLGREGGRLAAELGDRLSGAWDSITSGVEDLGNALGEAWELSRPLVETLGMIAGGAVVGGIIALATAFESVAGFLAENEWLVRLLVTALTALAGVKLASALVGVMETFALKVMYARDRVGDLASRLGDIKAGGLAGVSSNAVAGGLAFAGFSAILYAWQDEAQKAKREAAQLQQAIDSLTSAAESSGRTITEEFTASNLVDLWADGRDQLTDYGISLADLRKGLTGTREDFDAMIEAAVGDIDNLDEAGLVKVLEAQRDAFDGATEKADGLAEARENLGTETVSTVEAEKASMDAVTQSAAAYEELAQQVDEAYDSIREYYGMLSSTIETEIAARQAIDGTAETIKANIEEYGSLGRAFDITTKAGQDNTLALLESRDAIVEHALAVAKQNDSVDDGKLVMALYADELRKAATEAGASKAEVEGLIEKLELTPEQISLNFDAEFGGVLAATEAAETLASLLSSTSWTAHLDVDDEEVRATMDTVEGLLDSYVTSNPEAQAFLDISDPEKRAAAVEDMLDAFAESNPTAKAHLDTLPAAKRTAWIKAEVARFTSKKWTANIGARAYGLDAVNLALNTVARTRTARVDAVLGALPRIPGISWGSLLRQNRWGGVENYAAGGVRQALLGTGRNMVWWDEPETGGEAYVPRLGNRSRSLGVLDTAAGWYGMRVVPMAAGGIRSVPYQPTMGGGGGDHRVTTLNVSVSSPNPQVAGSAVIAAIRDNYPDFARVITDKERGRR